MIRFREHQTENEQCWCRPEAFNICPECDDDIDDVASTGKVIAKKDCWRCGGDGLVEVYDEDLPALIVHRETE